MNKTFLFIQKLTQLISNTVETPEELKEKLPTDLNTLEQNFIEQYNNYLLGDLKKSQLSKSFRQLILLKTKTEELLLVHSKSLLSNEIKCKAVCEHYQQICNILNSIRKSYQGFISSKFIPSEIVCQPQKAIVEAYCIPTHKNDKKQLLQFCSSTSINSQLYKTLHHQTQLFEYKQYLSPYYELIENLLENQKIHNYREEKNLERLLQTTLHYLKCKKKNEINKLFHIIGCLVLLPSTPLILIDDFLDVIALDSSISKDADHINPELLLYYNTLSSYIFNEELTTIKQQNTISYLSRKLKKQFNHSEEQQVTIPKLTCTLPPKEFVKTIAGIVQKGDIKVPGSKSVKQVYEVLVNFIEIKKEKGLGYITPTSMHTYHKEIIEEQLDSNRSFYKMR